jgi:Predicted membrane protein
VAYALSLPVMEAVIFDFHEVAFVPVLNRGDGRALRCGKRWQGVLAAVALLLVKEDMGLLVAGFGGYLLLTRGVNGPGPAWPSWWAAWRRPGRPPTC